MIFNHLDIIFAAVILIASIRGAARGFVTEILSMAAIILAIAAAVLFSAPLSVYVAEILGPSFWNQVIAFLVLFLIVYLIVKVVEGLLHTGIDRLHLRKLDRVLGFLLGLVEGILVVLLALFLLYLQPFFDVDSALETSLFARVFLRFLTPAETIPGYVFYCPGVYYIKPVTPC